MATSLTNESKNSLSLSMEGRVVSPTWDEMTETWDEVDETWDTKSKPIWNAETKTNLSLTLETKP